MVEFIAIDEAGLLENGDALEAEVVVDAGRPGKVLLRTCLMKAFGERYAVLGRSKSAPPTSIEERTHSPPVPAPLHYPPSGRRHAPSLRL